MMMTTVAAIQINSELLVAARDQFAAEGDAAGIAASASIGAAAAMSKPVSSSPGLLSEGLAAARLQGRSAE